MFIVKISDIFNSFSRNIIVYLIVVIVTIELQMINFITLLFYLKSTVYVFSLFNHLCDVFLDEKLNLCKTFKVPF